MSDGTTKKRRPKPRKVGGRSEYDFSNGVRGKYAEQYAAGTNVVLLDPEVAAVFPNSSAVNDALRSLIAPRAGRPKRKD